MGGPERLVAGSIAALVAYHAARVGYFGYLLPTPYVVKVAAVGEYGLGLRQASREVASASALLAATALFRRTVSPWAGGPFLVQVALLVRADGDWMGHARFLVPGLAASLAAAWTSGVSRRPGWWAWGMVGSLGVAGFVVEPTRVPAAGGAATAASSVREVGRLLHPFTSVRTPWAVPLIEETSFLVTRLPAGAGAELSDVGLPGNLPDVPIWDASGLTDRVVADAVLAHARAIPPEITERYRAARVWCVRYLQGAGGAETADGPLLALYPEVTPSLIGVPDLVWRCREGGEPGAELVAERWERLLDRYPSQDWIRWYYVRSLLELGRLGDARAAADDATWMAGHGLAWTLFGGIPFNRYQPGRGWAKYENGAISSMAVGGELWQGIAVGLDVDDPGPDGAAVRVRWEPECGSPMEVIVRGRTEIEPPMCATPGPRALVVEFLNDAYVPGVDRNIYVEALGR